MRYQARTEVSLVFNSPLSHKHYQLISHQYMHQASTCHLLEKSYLLEHGYVPHYSVQVT